MKLLEKGGKQSTVSPTIFGGSFSNGRHDALACGSLQYKPMPSL